METIKNDSRLVLRVCPNKNSGLTPQHEINLHTRPQLQETERPRGSSLTLRTFFPTRQKKKKITLIRLSKAVKLFQRGFKDRNGQGIHDATSGFHSALSGEWPSNNDLQGTMCSSAVPSIVDRLSRSFEGAVPKSGFLFFFA